MFRKRCDSSSRTVMALFRNSQPDASGNSLPKTRCFRCLESPWIERNFDDHDDTPRDDRTDPTSRRIPSHSCGVYARDLPYTRMNHALPPSLSLDGALDYASWLPSGVQFHVELCDLIQARQVAATHQARDLFTIASSRMRTKIGRSGLAAASLTASSSPIASRVFSTIGEPLLSYSFYINSLTKS